VSPDGVPVGKVEQGGSDLQQMSVLMKKHPGLTSFSDSAIYTNIRHLFTRTSATCTLWRTPPAQCRRPTVGVAGEASAWASLYDQYERWQARTCPISPQLFAFAANHGGHHLLSSAPSCFVMCSRCWVITRKSTDTPRNNSAWPTASMLNQRARGCYQRASIRSDN
jgi:hypothetical protein